MRRSAATLAAIGFLVLACQLAVIPRASASDLSIPSASCIYEGYNPSFPWMSLVCSEADLAQWLSIRGLAESDLFPIPERLPDGTLEQGVHWIANGEQVLFARYIHDEFVPPPARTREEVQAAYLATLGITAEQVVAGSTFTPTGGQCGDPAGFAETGTAATLYSGRVRFYRYCGTNPAGRHSGRSILYIEGHGLSFADIGMDTISWLASLGFDVYAADFTFWGTNSFDAQAILGSHDDYAYVERSPVSPLWTEILAPYAGFVSYIRGLATGPIGIVGRSGGGMAAYSVGTIHPDVDYVVSIAGGTPMSMRLAPEPVEIGDWEQWSPRTYRFVGHEELMRSAGRTGGLYAYGGLDPCCFRVAPGDGFYEWMSAPAADGRIVALVVDPVHDEHSLSEGSKPAVLSFLDTVLGAMELSVAISGSGTGTVTSSPAGIDCGATCEVAFLPGNSVTLTAAPAIGSAFAGWSGGGCAGIGACTVTMDAARQVTATFVPLVAFSVWISGAQQAPPTPSLASGSGTVVIDTAANTITYAFSVAGLSGPLIGAYFHGPAVRGANADVKIDVSGNPLSGSVPYEEPDEASLLDGRWYASFRTAAFPAGEARGQFDDLGGVFLLAVASSGTGAGVVTSSPAGIHCGNACGAVYASGSLVTLTATPAPGSTFTGWGGACSGTEACTVTIDAATSVTAGFTVQRLDLTVTKSGDGSGTVTSDPAAIDCGSVCSASLDWGTVVTLVAVPADGSVFAGWSGGGCTGTGTCVVQGSAMSSVSAEFVLATSIPRLANLSTRGQVQTGNDVMIAGFIIAGSAPKRVLITARGPSLSALGVPGVLSDPMIELLSGQTIIARNDNWGNAPNLPDIQASGLSPSSPLESAILVTLDPGAYTAIVSGERGVTGVGIVEVFEIDAPEVPLANLSTRGLALAGDSVMIGGFIVQGNSPKTVLIRARGPSLADFGVPGILSNPLLRLYSGQTPIAANDDWVTSLDATSIEATGLAPTSGVESAILVTLNPGAYTAIVSGADGGSGVGIVEVFAR